MPVSSTSDSPKTPTSSRSTSDEPSTLPSGLIDTGKRNPDGLQILEDPNTGHSFLLVNQGNSSYLLDAQTGDWVSTDAKGAPRYDASGAPIAVGLQLNYQTQLTLEDKLRFMLLLLAPPSSEEAQNNEAKKAALDRQQVQQQLEMLDAQKQRDLESKLKELKVLTHLSIEQQEDTSKKLKPQAPSL